MPKPPPFSVTPDAEDYLRSRLNVMPPEADPVIVMATKLGDALDSCGEKIRSWYEGENFDVCYFDPAEQPQTEQIELLGRSTSITPEALKHLTGHTLALRRVKSAYGLFSAPHYVLVADSAPESSVSTLGKKDSYDKTQRNLSIVALTVLGGFSGMGVVWIASATIANILKIPDDKFLPLTLPLFVAGWIIGAAASFFFFQYVYKAKGKTKFAQEQMERKYVGYGGLGAEMNWWIFVGIPTPLIITLTLVLEQFARTIGQKTAVVFVAIMIVGVPVMYFSDRIPRRTVIRLGLLGWILTIIGGYWYFKTHGP
jgi:hypothetical protein